MLTDSYSDRLLGADALIEAAREAMGRAHAPYSRFHVGAALRAEDGSIHAGANVENAAYPQGQCAEASAIGVLVAAGRTRVLEAAVIADSEAICVPCGGCRQRLREFMPLDGVVHLVLVQRRAAVGDARDAAPDVLRPGVPAVMSDRIAARAPRLGIVLGSGLGAVAEALEDAEEIPYTELPDFPAPSVHGHAGTLALGTLSGLPVACLQGRRHVYEGGDPGAMRGPVRALKAAGAQAIFVTNAAGSLNAEVGPGSLMAISDHINMLSVNPLTGPNDDAIGPRFPSLRDAYDPELRGVLRETAGELGIELAEGVYLATAGPSFETPAEIRAFRTLGRRRRRHVDRARGHPRPPRRPQSRRRVRDHQPGRGHGRRGALARADPPLCQSGGRRPDPTDHRVLCSPLRSSAASATGMR